MSKKQKGQDNNSLSSIVSNLIRSSLGSTSTALNAVEDDKLDRHVADLLLLEAKQKQDNWGNSGRNSRGIEAPLV